MNTTRITLFLLSIAWTTAAFVANNYRSYQSSVSSRYSSAESCLWSSVGGGEDNLDDHDESDDNPINEWISRKDSENIRIAREQMAEDSLPISFGAMGTDDERDDDKIVDKDSSGNEVRVEYGQFGPISADSKSNNTEDAVDVTSSTSSLARGKTNPYLNVVSRLSPSDLIARFTATASPR